MLDTVINLVIGAAGTACYLYLWRRILSPEEGCNERPSNATADKPRWRLRTLQIFFFLALTPYVLFLFFLMEKAKSLLGAVEVSVDQ